MDSEAHSSVLQLHRFFLLTAVGTRANRVPRRIAGRKDNQDCSSTAGPRSPERKPRSGKRVPIARCTFPERHFRDRVRPALRDQWATQVGTYTARLPRPNCRPALKPHLNRFSRTFGVLPHSRCKAVGSVGSGISLARRSSTPALPYISTASTSRLKLAHKVLDRSDARRLRAFKPPSCAATLGLTVVTQPPGFDRPARSEGVESRPPSRRRTRAVSVRCQTHRSLRH